MKTVKPKDIKGDHNITIDIKNSERACMKCLPPTPLDGHPTLYGIMIHSRIDCPDGMVYMLNEKKP